MADRPSNYNKFGWYSVVVPRGGIGKLNEDVEIAIIPRAEGGTNIAWD